MAQCPSLGLSFSLSESIQCAGWTLTVSGPPNVPELTLAVVRSSVSNATWLTTDQPLEFADLAPFASTIDVAAGNSTRLLNLPAETPLDLYLFLPASLGSLGCAVRQDWIVTPGVSTCDLLDVPTASRSSSSTTAIIVQTSAASLSSNASPSSTASSSPVATTAASSMGSGLQSVAPLGLADAFRSWQARDTALTVVFGTLAVCCAVMALACCWRRRIRLERTRPPPRPARPHSASIVLDDDKSAATASTVQHEDYKRSSSLYPTTPRTPFAEHV